MKQQDFLTIIGAVVISAVFSFIVSGKLFASPKDRSQQVEVVSPISATFQKTDSTYFHPGAIDPTQTIFVSPNNNTAPFAISTSN